VTVDYNVSSILSVGTPIPGVEVTVSLSGGMVQVFGSADIEVSIGFILKNIGIDLS